MPIAQSRHAAGSGTVAIDEPELLPGAPPVDNQFEVISAISCPFTIPSPLTSPPSRPTPVCNHEEETVAISCPLTMPSRLVSPGLVSLNQARSGLRSSVTVVPPLLHVVGPP